VAEAVNDPVGTSATVDAVTGTADSEVEDGGSDRVNTLAKSVRCFLELVHITLAGHWKGGIPRRAQSPRLQVSHFVHNLGRRQ
jgi:hypothetical protein